ncbi:MAG: transposase [Candidatus Uhrbacteria bacterium]
MTDLNIHRPHHDQMNLPGEYFITGRMLDQKRLMAGAERKHLFFDVLINLCHRHKLDLIAWIILDNHYHILIASDTVFELSKFMSSLHAVTSKLLNDEDDKRGRKVWDQYWDRRIRNETDSWKSFNYIHWNSIKHGIAKNLDEVKQNQFCSFGLWFELLGEELVETFFEQYPIDQFDLKQMTG